MHTFDIVLVLLPEQYAILFTHQSSRSSYQDRQQSFLLVQVFQHVVLRWGEINNQLHDIVVTLIRQVVL
jgi:hypothetical protein